MNETFIKAYQDQIEAAKNAFATGNFTPPNFSALEVPPAVREIAEKSLSSVRDSYEKVKAAADQANSAIEDACSSASKGISEYNVKALEALHTNVSSTFDFYTSLLSAKSLAEAVELSTSHVRKQFETVSGQAKDLSALAQKVAAESSEPLKAGVEKAMNTAA